MGGCGAHEKTLAELKWCVPEAGTWAWPSRGVHDRSATWYHLFGWVGERGRMGIRCSVLRGMVALAAASGALPRRAHAIILSSAASAPVSVAVSSDGSQAFAAGESRLRVFELTSPPPELSASTTFVNGVGGVSGIRGSISVSLDS